MPTNAERLARIQGGLQELYLPRASELARLLVEKKGALSAPIRFTVDVSEMFPGVAGGSKGPVTFDGNSEDPLQSFEQLIRSVPNRITNGERIIIGQIDWVFEEMLKILRR